MSIEFEIAETRGLDGTLTIRADGAPDVVIADEPWHHLMHLCAVMQELSQGRSVGVPYSSMPRDYADRWLSAATMCRRLSMTSSRLQSRCSTRRIVGSPSRSRTRPATEYRQRFARH